MISKDISVILNVYKRPHILEQQIQAIKNQSIKIKSENIHVWYNDNIKNLPKDDKIKYYLCSWNTKFWGRFTIPLMLDTEYIAVFDDDTIPHKDWLKNCLETINNKETNGILGGSGVILIHKAYNPFIKVGWNGDHLKYTKRVDLCGHAWFYRQEWSKYMWYEKPCNWNNGEDIMFSYLAQKYGNINTFVPPHPIDNIDVWSSNIKLGTELGNDVNASWLKNNHYEDRNAICVHCVNNGWKTVNNI